jgi:serine/threonine protein kinase/tetratricopeptide (TPR) repeat protein
MIGETISHYRITEKLGGGGMGVVYKAEDTRLKRTVALKFLPPDLTRDEQAKTRFVHEAQAASALQHPNICTIHDIDETADHQLFIVMDCYEGGTLKSLVAQGPLPVGEAVDIAIQVAQGLAKAHESGIVHRDIKPANIMTGKDGIARIVDFGLAKLSSQTVLTKSGSTLGTAAYMSPEQARGEKVDHRADIWSLGVVLYEMLTGHKPFESEYEQALMYAIMSQTPDAMAVSRKDVPIKLEQIVSKCLEKDASHRYQSADELLIDLRESKAEATNIRKGVIGQILARTIWGRKKWTKRAVLVGVPLVLVLAWFVYSTYFGAPKEPIPITVISFENQTGDSTNNYLRRGIPELLITSLGQSRYLRPTPWERLRDLMRQIGRAGEQNIDSDLGFELARRDSAKAIISGTLVKLGNVFVTTVTMYDVRSKELLMTTSSRGEGEGSIDGQIDELSRKISTGIGIPSSVVKVDERPIKEMTTTSTEARRYYIRGISNYENFQLDEALASLRKAVELDSTFAMAHYYLSLVLTQMGDVTAKQALEEAMRHSGKASRKERLLIEGLHASVVERNTEKRHQILLELEKQYPNDKQVLNDLGRYYRRSKPPQLQQAASYFKRALALDPTWTSVSTELGYLYLDNLDEPEKAMEVFKRDVEANPGNPNTFDNLGDGYFVLGKIDSAIYAKREAKEADPRGLGADVTLIYLYALKEDYEASFKSVQTLISDTAWIGPGLFWRPFLHSWLGTPAQARGELDRIVEHQRIVYGSRFPHNNVVVYTAAGCMAFSIGRMELAADCFREAFRFSLMADPTDSLRQSAALVTSSAIAQLRNGDIQSAESKITKVKTSLQSSGGASRLLDNAEAELWLARGQPDSAIKRLSGLPPLRFRLAGVKWIELVTTNIFYRRDVLARAYLKKGDLDAAIQEYERITTFDPSSWDRRLIHPLDRYELAKLYEKKALKEKAIAQYEKFLGFWKNADRDRPEPKDARARLARLKGKR